jgi:hypothetical protein
MKIYREFGAVLATALILFGSISRLASATSPAAADACQAEALRAYWRALQFCQLAEPQNPRMRCYEAAKSVYIQTLQDCRTGHSSPEDPKSQDPARSESVALPK